MPATSREGGPTRLGVWTVRGGPWFGPARCAEGPRAPTTGSFVRLDGRFEGGEIGG
eukprot:CAMPEP_0204458014 /NCGR_PEP_ID=MMETSP0471-20130131/3203_1 /ASSEMBLY_ACC=CAM_ASM_000602 /TAXON_ID=2969 /ORGANISM="Oxyrrhis marina" /LENGTH=55 /DNA_ID=CAMNT_0051458551 /DNA_START=45 /DNA_END=208 /DNA_ORIENTATION=-